MNIYEAINSKSNDADYMTATVINGAHTGEHALISADNIIYSDHESAFLADHSREICSASKNGIYNIAGEDIFIEKSGAQKKLVICGAGHVSIPVIKIGRMTGFEVTAIDDRPEFAQHAEEAGADHVICDAFSKALDSTPSDTDTFYVVVTRGHRWDKECLMSIFSKPYAYVGMMASRRRVALLKKDLLTSGISQSAIDTLHSPIGLEINAETPAEIAVSIMAQIISISRSGPSGGAFTQDILNGLLSEKHKKVLATIVSRKGSAPRSIGTKMLINDDGSCIGTIGGGCAEVYVTAHAGSMLSSGSDKPALIDVDMTTETAADEGMVCGGVIKVLLEPV